MKTNLNAKRLPLFTAALGCAALLARMGLFALGRDEKGLLIPGHPLDILVWGLTAAAIILIAAAAVGLGGSKKYSDNFAPSTAAALGCFALAGGIAVTVLSGWNIDVRQDLICNLFGLLAIPALVAAGLHRRKGKQPFFLFHAVVCLYLILYAINHYHLWSSRPQIQNWFFPMAGSLSLTIFAYYQTAFDVSMGSRRMQLGTGLAAAFFCLTAMAGGNDVLLYLGGAVWALTNLCNLTPVSRRRKNPITNTNREELK